jgi:zinc/manganese transport system substrate-binding protein
MSRPFLIVFFTIFSLILLLIYPHRKEPQPEATIVTTFSILEDITKNIIGTQNQIIIKSIVPLYTDPHTYQPKPQDAKLIHKADIVIVNGLGFEGWLDKFIIASDFKGTLITATNNLIARHQHTQEHNNTIDPHAWHSIPHVIGYVTNIEKALSTHYPNSAAIFQKNAKNYIEKLQQLDAELTLLFRSIAKEHRYVVTTHDAFWYFGEHYNIKFLSPIGTDTEQEPSAKDIKTLIHFIKQHNVRAIFIENLSNQKQIQKIAQETGIEAAGPLYADGLSDEKHTAATYLDMMRYNAYLIHQKLTDHMH